MSRLEFFFDYGSPYSYLADTQLPGLRERTGCEIVYRPILLGGVFKATPASARVRFPRPLPEGTRHDTGRMWHRGLARLARAAVSAVSG